MERKVVVPGTTFEFRVAPSAQKMRVKISTNPTNSAVVVTSFQVGGEDRIVGSPEPVWPALDNICALDAERPLTIRVRNEGSTETEVTVRLVPD
jgi:hypothetical protein